LDEIIEGQGCEALFQLGLAQLVPESESRIIGDQENVVFPAGQGVAGGGEKKLRARCAVFEVGKAVVLCTWRRRLFFKQGNKTAYIVVRREGPGEFKGRGYAAEGCIRREGGQDDVQPACPVRGVRLKLDVVDD
jgi:hypothetical protein